VAENIDIYSYCRKMTQNRTTNLANNQAANTKQNHTSMHKKSNYTEDHWKTSQVSQIPFCKLVTEKKTNMVNEHNLQNQKMSGLLLKLFASLFPLVVIKPVNATYS